MREIRYRPAMDVTTRWLASDRLELSSGRGRIELDVSGADELEAWRQLVSHGWPVDRPLERALVPFFASTRSLASQGWLDEVLRDDEREILRISVLSPMYRPRVFDPSVPHSLSRFALLRREGTRLVMESPRALAKVVFLEAPDRLASLLSGECPEDEGGRMVFEALVRCGLLVPEEVEPDAIRQWEFHDLLFHGRSRAGRHASPMGNVYPFRGEIEPLPPRKMMAGLRSIPLPRPDMRLVEGRDPAFSAVLERRRSRREAGDVPVDFHGLSEFLFRTCRTTRSPDEFGTMWRLYPSGGGLHSLEVYLLVARCEGLEPSLYHYDPEEHGLTELRHDREAFAALLRMAARAQGTEDPGGVLFLITTRFARVSWKYRSIAYSLVLKDLGGLFQTMYLVATAMGISPCALGLGNADLFVRLTGIPYEEEGSVGEFALR